MSEISDAVERLSYFIEVVPRLLQNRKEEDFSLPPWLGKWSKKQILGHLIDSAANNHQRFVRIQYEKEPVVFYNQDQWVNLQRYNAADSEALISLWHFYNQHLLHVIKNIPDENLQREGISKEGSKHTLEWYVKDYVDHMEHHLKQLFGENFLASL